MADLFAIVITSIPAKNAIHQNSFLSKLSKHKNMEYGIWQKRVVNKKKGEPRMFLCVSMIL